MAATLLTIQTFIDDLRVDSTTGTVDVQSEGLRAINHILQHMQAKHDWEFTQEDLNFRYYPRIYSYSLPTQYKSPRSLYPLADFIDDFRYVEPSVFKRLVRTNNSESLMAVERASNKRLFVHYPRTKATSQVLEANTDYTNNGNWTADIVNGDGSNVRSDLYAYFENTGSVAFDVIATQSVANCVILEKNLTTAVDATAYRNGGLFFKMYLPSNSYISSFTIRLGSSSTDYLEKTVTTQFDGAYFENGWNQLGFEFGSVDETGTVDIANIDYIYFKMSYSSSMSDTRNFRISEMTLQNYEDMNFKFYTYNMVNDVSAGYNVRKFDGTDTNDEFLFPDEMESLVQVGAAWILLRQMGEPAQAEEMRIQYEGSDKNGGLLKTFMDQFPSKTKKPEPPQLLGPSGMYPSFII